MQLRGKQSMRRLGKSQSSNGMGGGGGVDLTTGYEPRMISKILNNTYRMGTCQPGLMLFC